MTFGKPLVSVVTVIHNYGRFIDEALASAFAQPYRPIEVIVVDDGSTDDSADRAAAHPGVILIRQHHQGVSAARNAALRRGAGEFVTFLDADDVMGATWLTEAVPHMIRCPGIAVAFPQQTIRLEPGIPKPGWISPDSVHGDLDGLPLAAGLYRRSVFDELGWFTDNIRTGEFFNLLSRLPDQNTRTSFLKVLGVERRIHGSNLTYEIDALSENMLRSLRHRIEQRRRS